MGVVYNHNHKLTSFVDNAIQNHGGESIRTGISKTVLTINILAKGHTVTAAFVCAKESTNLHSL